MDYVEYNANPAGKRVGDCVIRSLSKVLDQDWETTFMLIMMKAYEMHDMPSSNIVWGAVLKDMGFKRKIIPNRCPDCYTVKDFCRDHPTGAYVVCPSGHVVAVVDGKYYDTWDSGEEIPVYYFEKE